MGEKTKRVKAGLNKKVKDANGTWKGVMLLLYALQDGHLLKTHTFTYTECLPVWQTLTDGITRACNSVAAPRRT